ncbi:hypothetical protein Pst134EA_024604 [Puccinia striiformis f. sp. tritici]|uniref:hypothetical protein n=1 Tax=Puccinia striiformis f. sp. tritici TaxID=168172 RepID=UPI002007F38B|nr:hypothetical protein Pst134EA_024604 [Puccinia striiformis f. sp. tritici]KAH9453741.1 hypothetical protein Pst134EA_024604 [Puccinia striiformis f. sp. tritici]
MSSFAASDNMTYSILSSHSGYLNYPRPTHSYGLRPQVPAIRENGGRPALCSTRAFANAPVVHRPGLTWRPAPARQPNRQGPARGRRDGPVVSPAISAVRGLNSRGFRNNCYVLPLVRMSLFSIKLPTEPPYCHARHQTPPSHTWSYVQRNMVSDPNRPPSPTWADVLRNPAPNRDSPLFRPVVLNTPPGLCMAMDIPEPKVLPFVLGQAVLDDIFRYLQGNNAVAELEPEAGAEPPALIILDEDPAGFEPSHAANDWANRGTSISSGSSRPSTADTTASNSYHNIQFHRLNKEQIHFLLEDQTQISHYNLDRFQTINNENKYFFHCLSLPAACSISRTAIP